MLGVKTFISPKTTCKPAACPCRVWAEVSPVRPSVCAPSHAHCSHYSVTKTHKRMVACGEEMQGKNTQCTFNVTLRRFRATTVAVEKRCVTYSKCVFVALGIQHAVRMPHFVACGLSGCTNFSALLHKLHDFWKKKKVIEHQMFLYNFFLRTICHSKKKWSRCDHKCLLVIM